MINWKITPGWNIHPLLPFQNYSVLKLLGVEKHSAGRGGQGWEGVWEGVRRQGPKRAKKVSKAGGGVVVMLSEPK